ncbi:putative glycosyltransferase [Plesiocystis pacifica SIR-1]|uniref:Putative glycosyltransferase n=1 Tax=Plesiocystis pacifica SIR-1 TaxID=391625 RepID=A6G488_9BACT|nr:glycosyltransferase [Plesiocystis pacifica]EDM79411.1 putative glycosyltransferase [Plesiocystis pacifica SIR-1]
MSDARARWLLVSRPVVGHPIDGGPALLRALIPALPSQTPVDYFGDPRDPPRLGRDDGVIRVPRLPGGRGAGLFERAAIGAVLVGRERRRQPVHLFLAPGPLMQRVAAGLLETPPVSRSTSLVQRATSGARSWLGVASSMLRTRQAQHARPAPVVQTLTEAAGFEDSTTELEALDAIVVLSAHTRSRLIGAGVPGHKVHCIYPGVDVRHGPSAPRDLDALAQRRRILFAGDLDVGAVDRIIELVRTANEEPMRGWSVVVQPWAQGGEVQERAQARLARELAGAIGSSRVELLPPTLDGAHLAGLMGRCSLQLAAADDLRFGADIPMTLLQGLAAGLPLVTLDHPAVREVLNEGESRGLEVGLRVDPSSGPHALVAAIHELTAKPERLLAMSQAAATLAREAFSAARMGADYAALHREILAGYEQR